MPARGLSPIRPEWNRMGPHVSPSFRARLKDIDPLLELQFVPPTTADPCGVNVDIYPYGVWDIGKVINGRFFHPKVIYSLADEFGRFAPPGADTIRLIRLAYRLFKNGESWKMDLEMERVINQGNMASCAQSTEALNTAMERFAILNFDRQYSNRVFIRREYMEKVERN